MLEKCLVFEYHTVLVIFLNDGQVVWLIGIYADVHILVHSMCLHIDSIPYQIVVLGSHDGCNVTLGVIVGHTDISHAFA